MTIPETLRAAADKADRLIENLPYPDAWFDNDVDLRNAIRGTFQAHTGRPEAAFIAACSPAFLRGVAAMWRSLADRAESIIDTFAPGSRMGHAMALESVAGMPETLTAARAFLGEEATP